MRNQFLLKVLKFLSALLVVVVAAALRIYAAQTLIVNPDEPAYLDAALEYANYMREEKWTWLAWSQNNFEHPAFNKIVYGVVLLTQDPIDSFYKKDLPRGAPIQTAEAKPWAMACRYTSVSFGVIAVAVLAVINPLAGLFLAIQTYSITYTSLIYLEALPLLTSLLSAIFYLRWMEVNPFKSWMWLSLSALMLGMTAASKYLYCVVGIAISVHFCWISLRQKLFARRVRWMVAWAILSILAFFFLDPYLWPHPIDRLVQSITYLGQYTSSHIVAYYHFPVWQPLKWISTPYSEFFPNTRSSFLIGWDTWIALLALIGIPRLFWRQSLFFIWLICGMIILLAWPTKWPQYVLIMMVPFCISTAEAVIWIINLLCKGWNFFLARFFSHPNQR